MRRTEIALVPSFQRPASRVAIRRAASYEQDLAAVIYETLREFELPVKDKTVLLKPNLVGLDPLGVMNTHPCVIAAARESFLRMGAAQVLIGDGPAMDRDIEAIIESVRLREFAGPLARTFVDLNVDDVKRVALTTRASRLKELFLPKTVLGADFLVSMPKLKTHHWAGVTLSLKNMFGIVPGMKYGWPKNLLHWHRIHESILDICATVPIHFVIADGITAMEGNGPLQGTARGLGKIVLADDPVAADATCARLMGLDPLRVQHLSDGGRFLGNLNSNRIMMLGERVEPPARPFSVLPDFEYLIAPTR